MILSKLVKITIKPKTLKHFLKLGYNNKIGDKIEIPVNHLTNGSKTKIKVKCDICNKEKEIMYSRYLKNYNNYNTYTCSQKCAQFKNKRTNLEKYGVEHVLQLKKFKNKREQTLLKLYNNKNYNNREQMKETMKGKWDKVVKNRRKNCLSKYGVVSMTQLKKTQEKMKQTCLKLYGVESPLQSKEIQKKIRQTCLKNLGVTYPTQSFKIIKKQIETMTGLSYEKYIKQLPKYKKYRRNVIAITRKQPLYLLKNYNKRGNSGIIGAYQLDHKFSIKKGFINNIPPYIIGNIVNIEMLTWKNNISKYDKCSISKKELFENFDNRDKILKELKKYQNL